MYIRVSIKATEQQQEELIALLSDFNPAGFEQTSDELIAYFNEADFYKEAIKRVIDQYPFNIKVVEEQNWNTLWETNFQPVVIDHFCAVRAHFHQPISGVQHEIIITPKMSFGTGHHATTYMMLQQMKEIDFKDKKVFDFGTGTGILSIMAEKLGAAQITAIDVDDWSIRNAAENFRKNGCTKIKVCLSSHIPQGAYDIILANINRNVILQYLPQLRKVLKKNGHILFSGLLNSDEPDLIHACAHEQLYLIRKTERDSWIALLFITEMS
ncbi:MAG: 50S ribosomal protein L11 methyltransferase [Bacteroidota bacterium]|nr:50S ribosomal protein L11 methyltransferase [Bacteroidota bacterium]